ncbi:hypothetical protein LCGC14_2137120 [marine sediment metagenome]|uniref:Uncharacterized protein n=1 Tax=marine sediment metagenome TaxID=412755 RepID=A0A0F9GVS3_9ZZZZ
MGLSKKELEEEIRAIGESIAAHESQMKLHVYALKVDAFLKELLEKDLKSRK